MSIDDKKLKRSAALGALMALSVSGSTEAGVIVDLPTVTREAFTWIDTNGSKNPFKWTTYTEPEKKYDLGYYEILHDYDEDGDIDSDDGKKFVEDLNLKTTYSESEYLALKALIEGGEVAKYIAKSTKVEYDVANAESFAKAVEYLSDKDVALDKVSKRALLVKHYPTEVAREVISTMEYADAKAYLATAEANGIEYDDKKALLVEKWPEKVAYDIKVGTARTKISTMEYADAKAYLATAEGIEYDDKKALLVEKWPEKVAYDIKVDTARIKISTMEYADAKAYLATAEANGIEYDDKKALLVEKWADNVAYDIKVDTAKTAISAMKYADAIAHLASEAANGITDDDKEKLLQDKYGDEHYIVSKKLDYDEAVTYLAQDGSLSGSDASLLAIYYPDNVANDYVESNKEQLGYDGAKDYLTKNDNQLSAFDLAVLAKCYPYDVAKETIASMDYEAAKTELTNTKLVLSDAQRIELLVAKDGAKFAADYLISSKKPGTLEVAKQYLVTELEIKYESIENLLDKAYPYESAQEDIKDMNYAEAKAELTNTKLVLSDAQKIALLVAKDGAEFAEDYLASTKKPGTLEAAKQYLVTDLKIQYESIESFFDAAYPYESAQEDIKGMNYADAKAELSKTTLNLEAGEREKLLIAIDANAFAGDYLGSIYKADTMSEAIEYLEGFDIDVSKIESLLDAAYPVDAAREDISSITDYEDAKDWLNKNTNLEDDDKKALLQERWAYNVKVDEAKVAIQDMEYSAASQYLKDQGIGTGDRLTILGEKFAVDIAKEAANKAFEGKSYTEAKIELQDSKYNALDDNAKNGLLALAYPDEYTVATSTSYEEAVNALQKDENGNLTDAQKVLLGKKYPEDMAKDRIANMSYADAKAYFANKDYEENKILDETQKAALLGEKYPEAVAKDRIANMNYADAKAYFADKNYVENNKLDNTAKAALLGEKYPLEVAKDRIDNLSYADAKASLSNKDYIENGKLSPEQKADLLGEKYPLDVAKDRIDTMSYADAKDSLANADYVENGKLTAEQKTALLQAKYPNDYVVDNSTSYDKAVEALKALNDGNALNDAQKVLLSTKYADEYHLANTEGLTYEQAIDYLNGVDNVDLTDAQAALLAKYYPYNVADDHLANNNLTYDQAVTYLKGDDANKELTTVQKAMLAKYYPSDVADLYFASTNKPADLNGAEQYLDTLKTLKAEDRAALLAKYYAKEVANRDIACLEYSKAKEYLEANTKHLEFKDGDVEALLQANYEKEHHIVSGNLDYAAAKEYLLDGSTELSAVQSNLLNKYFEKEHHIVSGSLDYDAAVTYLGGTNEDLLVKYYKDEHSVATAGNYDDAVNYLKTLTGVEHKATATLLAKYYPQAVTESYLTYVKGTGDINAAREYLKGLGIDVSNNIIDGLIDAAYPVDAAREDISGIDSYDSAKAWLKDNTTLTPEQQNALLSERDGWAYKVKLDVATAAVGNMEYSAAREYLQSQGISITDQISILGEKLAIDVAKEAANAAFTGKTYEQAKSELEKSDYAVLTPEVKDALLAVAYHDEYTVEKASSYDAAVKELKDSNGNLTSKQVELLTAKYPQEHAVATSNSYEEAVNALKGAAGNLTEDQKQLIANKYPAESAVANSSSYEAAKEALTNDGALSGSDRELLSKYYANEYIVENSATYQDALGALDRGEDGKLTAAQVALLADKYPQNVAADHLMVNAKNMNKAQAEAYLATLTKLDDADRKALIVQYYSQDLANEYFAPGHEHSKEDAEAYLNGLNLTSEQKAGYLATHYPNQVAVEWLENNKTADKATAEAELKKLGNLTDVERAALIATYYPYQVAEEYLQNEDNKDKTKAQAETYLGTLTNLTADQKAYLLATYYPSEVAAEKIGNTKSYAEAIAYLQDKTQTEYEKLDNTQKAALLADKYPTEVAAARIADMDYEEAKTYFADKRFVENTKLDVNAKAALLAEKWPALVAADRIAGMTYEQAKAYFADKSFVENTLLDAWDKRNILEAQFTKEVRDELAKSMMGRMSYQVAKEFLYSQVAEEESNENQSSDDAIFTTEDVKSLLVEQYPVEVATEVLEDLTYEEAKAYLSGEEVNGNKVGNIAYDDKKALLEENWAEEVAYDESVETLGKTFELVKSGLNSPLAVWISEETKQDIEALINAVEEAAESGDKAALNQAKKDLIDKMSGVPVVGEFVDEVDKLLSNVIAKVPTPPGIEQEPVSPSNPSNPSNPSYDSDDLKDGLKTFLESIENYVPEAKTLLAALESGNEEDIRKAADALLEKVPFESIKQELGSLVDQFITGLHKDEQDSTATLEGAVNNLLTALQGNDATAIKNAINDLLQQVPDDQKQQVQDLLDKVLGRNDEEIQAALDDLKGIDEKLGKLVEFTEKIEETIDKANAKAEQLAGAIDKNVSAVEDKLKQNLAAVEDKLGVYESKLEDKLAQVDEKIKEKLNAVEGKVEQNLAKVDEKIKEKVNGIEDKIKDNLDAVDEKLKDNVVALEGKLQDSISKVEDKLQENLSKVDDKFQANVSAVEDKIQENVGKVETELKELAGDVQTHIEKNNQEHATLLDKTTDISYDKDSSTTKVENNLTVGGSLVANKGEANQVQINKNGIKVGLNSVYISGNDVSIGKIGEAGSIQLSTLGDIDKLKGDLAGSANVVDALNKEAAKRAEVDVEIGAAISSEIANRIENDKQLQANIDAEAAKRAEVDAEIGAAISSEIANRIENDKQLQANIDAEAAKRAEVDGQLGQAIVKETERAQGVEHELSTAITNEVDAREKADNAIRNEIASEFTRLDNRIDDVANRTDEVGAMAAAMASLHSMGYDPEAPSEIAIGIGQYRDTTGIAVGAFHYPNRDFMLNLSLSTAGDEVMANVSANWKIGRKKPEGKTFEEKVAKAEAMKAAAKAARAKAK